MGTTQLLLHAQSCSYFCFQLSAFLHARACKSVPSVLQNRELSADQKAQLKQQAQQFETQLASNSQDVEALEGAGVSYAQLGDFKRAEGLLSKLTTAKPQDAEAWRLLVCFQHCNLQPAGGGGGGGG